jgi:uncharacterized protein
MNTPFNEGSAEGQQTPPRKIESLEDRVASAFAGPHGIRAGWRWLIFVGILLACAAVLLVVCMAAGFLPRPGAPEEALLTAPSMAIQEAVLVIAMCIAAVVMSRIEKRPLAQYGLPARQAFRGLFWQGVIWGFVAITVTLALIAALRGLSFGKMTLFSGSLAGYAAMWGAAFLFTGFFEEFVFRGYSQFTITTGMGFWPAAVLLSILFGAIHLGNTGESWTGALSAGLIGFFCCFTLRRTGTIWFAVGLHFAWDYGETFVYGVPDSGIVAPGHLLNSSFHGARWLTGGAVGPEASAVCFGVLALLFVVFHFAYPAHSATETSGNL